MKTACIHNMALTSGTPQVAAGTLEDKGTTVSATSAVDGLGTVAMEASAAAPGTWCVIAVGRNT